MTTQINSIHVALVLPVLKPAGAERIVAELAYRLPQYGCTPTVICLEDERESIGVELRRANVPVIGLRQSRFNTLACARELIERLPRQRPLIIHAHLFHANLAARLGFAMMSQRDQVRVISTIHVAERRWRPWQFALDRLTSRYSCVEVCVSRAVARFQQARTRLPESFFRVIENGIDLQRYSIAPNDRSSGKHVVSVGRLDPQKGYPTLLRAWKVVEQEHSDARLSIAGDGPERLRLRELMGELGLKNVNFVGFVCGIPALLSSADVYVQSSAWEGFGLAAAEAMSSGVAPVVTDVDSLPEIVTEGETGLVVPQNNPGALANAISSLLSDPARRSELAANARREAIKRFDINRMVAEYAQLYRACLSD